MNREPSTGRPLALEETSKPSPVDQLEEPLAPRQEAEADVSRVILCQCGSAWNVVRTELPYVLSEHMTCVCGALLMNWCEAADYRFEELQSEGT